MNTLAIYDETQQECRIEAGTFAVTIRGREIEGCWNSLSQRPDSRARLELQALTGRVQSFFSFLEALSTRGGNVAADDAERFCQRHVSLTRRYWHMESRCASWFVVGPANFPTLSNEKRLNSSDKAAREILSHEKAAREAVRRRAFPYGEPDGVIRADNPDAPALLRSKIEALRLSHARMKEANATIRAVRNLGDGEKIDALHNATGISRSRCAELLRPDFAGRVGFPEFNLSGALAEIRRLELRLHNIETQRARGERAKSVVTVEGTVEVVEDPEAARLRLVFPGKPSAEARELLKGSGFRWAPSQGAWQRQLTENARYAATRVLNALAIKEEATI